MSGPFDMLLDAPLGAGAYQLLLFVTFALHLLLVLLAVGTALIAATGRLLAADERQDALSRRLLHLFFAHKSLAIVLGVAPLLIVFSSRPVPFLTAARLLAPLWILVIPLLLASLGLLELASHRARSGRRAALSAVAGTAVLLAVPAAFAALVVAAENPAAWSAMLSRGGELPPSLAVHWLARLLHLLAAAVVVAAVWHAIRAPAGERRLLLRWAAGGTVVQVLLGVALLASLPHPPDTVVWLVLIGVVAGVSWLAWSLRSPAAAAAGRAAVAVALVVAGMLVVRQLLQERSLLPLQVELRRAAAERRPALAPPDGEWEWITVGRPESIYLSSCRPCHGTVGNGAGDAAPRLRVQPEDLTGLVVSDRELTRILHSGVPGTAMPRFGFYTGSELARLVAFLRQPIGLGAELAADRRVPLDGVRRRFRERCGACHGTDGRPTSLAAGFVVPPPDLTALTVSDERGMTILATGYPGTLMPAFPDLDTTERRELIGLVQSLYAPS